MLNASELKFEVGNIVNVVKHGRGHSMGATAKLTSSHFNLTGRATVLGIREDGRVHIKYIEDGTEYHANPKKLRRLKPAAAAQSNKRVIVCFYTIEFRHALIHNLDASTSVVLEIGCHEGQATRIISKRSKFVVGIDVDSKVVEKAKIRHPDLHFEVCDGHNVEKCLSFSHQSPCNVVAIDVSGQASLSLAVPILHTWVVRHPDALIIIKNRKLYQALAFGSIEEEMGGQLKGEMNTILPLCQMFQRTDLSEVEIQKTEDLKRNWSNEEG